MEFEWELSKEIENIRKHHVTFSEAVESFFDPVGFQLVDEKHGSGEKRFYWIGRHPPYSDHLVYQTRDQDSNHRMCGVAQVSEALS